MEQKLKVGIVTLAGGFDVEWGKEMMLKAVDVLKNMDVDVVSPMKLVRSDEDARMAAKKFNQEGIDLLIIHHGTFMNGNLAVILAQEIHAPIVLWAMPEPSLGGRVQLRSNSLVGLHMNASHLSKLGIKYKYFYASPDDKEFQDSMRKYLKVVNAVKRLRRAKIGLAGYRVPGFYVSNFDEMDLRRFIGIEVRHIDLSQVLMERRYVPEDEAKKVAKEIEEKLDEKVFLSEEEARKIMESLKSRLESPIELKIETDPEKHFMNLAKTFLAFQRIFAKYDLDAMAVKCWPEFFMLFGHAACSTLGLLTDKGYIAGCEADMGGTVTMLLQFFLTGEPPFFADFVSINEKDNTGLMWHCGNAPLSLAARKGKKILEQSYYMGGAFQFSLKGGRVTFARLGDCLLYTSPSPRDLSTSRMPSSA